MQALEYWRAANGLCGCCALPVRQFNGTPKGSDNQAPTFDHVFPRNPLALDLPRLAKLMAVMPAGWNPAHRRKVVAHSKCNRRKENRLPTGCEIIFLMAVNARLDTLETVGLECSSATIKRRNRRRRKAAAKRMALEMQRTGA